MSKEEFAVFAGKYMDMIYRVAYSWMKNSHDANDVTQEVLIQLYRTTKEFTQDRQVFLQKRQRNMKVPLQSAKGKKQWM